MLLWTWEIDVRTTCKTLGAASNYWQSSRSFVRFCAFGPCTKKKCVKNSLSWLSSTVTWGNVYHYFAFSCCSKIVSCIQLHPQFLFKPFMEPQRVLTTLKEFVIRTNKRWKALNNSIKRLNSSKESWDHPDLSFSCHFAACRLKYIKPQWKKNNTLMTDTWECVTSSRDKVKESNCAMSHLVGCLTVRNEEEREKLSQENFSWETLT